MSRSRRQNGVAGAVLTGAVLLVASVMFLAVALPPPEMDLFARLTPPGGTTLLGSDQLGRPILARVLAGAPWSLGVAFAANAISLVLGVSAGLLAAEFEGVPRRIILQTVNLTLSFPSLVAAMAAVAILGQSAGAVILVLGLLAWPLFARVVYAEALSARDRPYVVAARIGGVSRLQQVFRHVLPVLLPSLTAMTAFHFADMLVASSALSFLGVGAPLGSPAWGAMLAESRPYLFLAPWMMAIPAAALALTVLLLNLCGDALAQRLGGRRRTDLRR
jgi:peptide/nickel transport system permease protein